LQSGIVLFGPYSCHAGSATDPKVATGVNIYQRGSDPPILPDSEYPEWLWGLVDKRKTIKQLHQLAKDVGGYEHLEPDDYFRLVKLERKMKIKAANAASRR
jgi:large subunit ribosomal protein L54